jgi:hypothetical protein
VTPRTGSRRTTIAAQRNSTGAAQSNTMASGGMKPGSEVLGIAESKAYDALEGEFAEVRPSCGNASNLLDSTENGVLQALFGAPLNVITADHGPHPAAPRILHHA